MEQLLEMYNSLMNASVIMMLVWFICTCINTYFHKKILYSAEMVVLLVNTAINIYQAYIFAIQEETPDWCIIFAGWAVICLGLLVITFKEYEKRFIQDK